MVERSLAGPVLLVDDEESVRATVEACLEAIGVGEVSVAESGEMALAMVAAQKPAVLLLDLLMPGTDGFAVLRALRGLQPNEQPERVIIMSQWPIRPWWMLLCPWGPTQCCQNRST